MPEEASLTYDPLTDENGYLVSDHEQAWLDTNQNSLTNNQTAKGKEKEEMPEASFFDDAFFEPSLERDLSSEKPQDMQASYGLANPPGLDELCRTMEARKANGGKGNDERANDDHDRHLYYYPRPENPSRIFLVDDIERWKADAERKGGSSSSTRADGTQAGPVPETHQQSHASSGLDFGAALTEQLQLLASASSSNAGVDSKQGSPFSEVHLGLPFDQEMLDLEEELHREANADFGGGSGGGVGIREESTSGEKDRFHTMGDFSTASWSATTPASCPRNEGHDDDDDDDCDEDESWFLPRRKRRRMSRTQLPTHGDGRPRGQ